MRCVVFGVLPLRRIAQRCDTPSRADACDTCMPITLLGLELIGEKRMYMTLPTAVAAYQQWVAAPRRHDGTASRGRLPRLEPGWSVAHDDRADRDPRGKAP